MYGEAAEMYGEAVQLEDKIIELIAQMISEDRLEEARKYFAKLKMNDLIDQAFA